MSIAHVVSVRSNSTLKRYFEIEITYLLVEDDFPNLVQLGITKSNPPASDENGSDNGVSIDLSGTTNVHGVTGSMYLGEGLNVGDVIQFVVSFTGTGPNSTFMWIGKNGVFPNGTTIPAGDVTGGVGFEDGTYYAHASAGDSSSFTATFGARLRAREDQFLETMPVGCVPWEDS